VIELTSPSTHREDLGPKRAFYERLGVREYFIFDPEGRRFRPPLRAYRRTELGLVPAPVAASPDGTLSAVSEVLGLELRGRRDELRWIDPATGERLPIPREQIERARVAGARAEAAEIRAKTAEEETARLREELVQLKRKGAG
jgi:hypothetical protein